MTDTEAVEARTERLRAERDEARANAAEAEELNTRQERVIDDLRERLRSVEQSAARWEAAFHRLNLDVGPDLASARATAREEGRRDGLEQAATVCDTADVPLSIDLWQGPRKELTAALAHALATRIRTLSTQPAQEAPETLQDSGRVEPQDTEAWDRLAAMSDDEVTSELRKSGLDPEAVAADGKALAASIRSCQDAPKDTSALFATVRAMLGHVVEDGREEAESTLSVLERCVGAMAQALQVFCALAERWHPPKAFGLTEAEASAIIPQMRLALTSTPPVFTLEEAEAAILDAAAAHDMAALRKRSEDECTDVAVTDGFTAGANCALEAVRSLRERAGGKP